MSAADPGTSPSDLDSVLDEIEREAARGHGAAALKQSTAYGAASAAAGRPAADVVLEVLRAVRAKVEQAGSAELGVRLTALGDLAASQAVAGWEAQQKEQREMWLSLLVHDLKNPLNTVVNVAWLLRGRLGQQADIAKLIGMIERGAQKIASGLADVRDLEARSAAGVPPRRTPK